MLLKRRELAIVNRSFYLKKYNYRKEVRFVNVMNCAKDSHQDNKLYN